MHHDDVPVAGGARMARPKGGFSAGAGASRGSGSRGSGSLEASVGEDDFSRFPLEKLLVHSNWKARKEGLTRVVHDPQRTAPALYDALGKLATENNAATQEVLFEALLAVVELANDKALAQLCEATLKLVVERGITGRPKAVQASTAFLDACVGLGRHEDVLTALLQAFEHKTPKNRSAALQTCGVIIGNYGVRPFNVKAILKALQPLFSDANGQVRKEVMNLCCQCYKFMGAGIKAVLVDVREVQLQELEKMFEGVQVGQQPPKSIKGLVVAKAPEPAPLAGLVTKSGNNGIIDDALFAKIDESPVLTRLPKNFYRVALDKSAKWQDRCDMVRDNLCPLLNAPKIRLNDDYHQLVSLIKEFLIDPQAPLMLLGFRCIQDLARCMRAAFTPYARVFLNPLFDKLKDKKSSVVEHIFTTLEALLQYNCITIEQCQEDIELCASSRVPNQRLATISWLTTQTERRERAQLARLSRATVMLSSLANDERSEIRDAAYILLHRLIALFGEKPFQSVIATLDSKQAAKFAAAGVPGPAAGTAPDAQTSGVRVRTQGVCSLMDTPSTSSPAKKMSRVEIAAAPRKPVTGLVPNSNGAGAMSTPSSAAAPGNETVTRRKNLVMDDAVALESTLPPKDEAAIRMLGLLRGDTTVTDLLRSKDWNQRYLGISKVKAVVDSWNVAATTANLSTVLVFLRVDPGWRESIFQVFQVMVTVLLDMCKKATTVGLGVSYAMVAGCTPRLTEGKNRSVIRDVLTHHIERAGVAFVIRHMITVVLAVKTPKLTQEVTDFLHHFLETCGSDVAIEPRCFVDFVRQCCPDRSPPPVKTSSVQLLLELRRKVEPPMAQLLTGVSPSILSQYEQEVAAAEGDMGRSDPSGGVPASSMRAPFSGSTSAGRTARHLDVELDMGTPSRVSRQPRAVSSPARSGLNDDEMLPRSPAVKKCLEGTGATGATAKGVTLPLPAASAPSVQSPPLGPRRSVSEKPATLVVNSPVTPPHKPGPEVRRHTSEPPRPGAGAAPRASSISASSGRGGHNLTTLSDPNANEHSNNEGGVRMVAVTGADGEVTMKPDVSSEFTQLRKGMQSGDWKVRLASVRGVDEILLAHNRCIAPNGAAELFRALRERFNEANKNFVVDVLRTMTNLIEAAGVAACRAGLKHALPGILSFLGDQKSSLREEATELAYVGLEVLGIEAMLPMLLRPVTSDAHICRQTALDLIEQGFKLLPPGATVQRPLVLPLVDPVVKQCMDRILDIRAAAERVIGYFIPIVGLEVLDRAVKDLKPAEQQAVLGPIERQLHLHMTQGQGQPHLHDTNEAAVSPPDSVAQAPNGATMVVSRPGAAVSDGREARQTDGSGKDALAAPAPEVRNPVTALKIASVGTLQRSPGNSPRKTSPRSSFRAPAPPSTSPTAPQGQSPRRRSSTNLKSADSPRQPQNSSDCATPAEGREAAEGLCVSSPIRRNLSTSAHGIAGSSSSVGQVEPQAVQRPAVPETLLPAAASGSSAAAPKGDAGPLTVPEIILGLRSASSLVAYRMCTDFMKRFRNGEDCGIPEMMLAMGERLYDNMARLDSDLSLGLISCLSAMFDSPRSAQRCHSSLLYRLLGMTFDCLLSEQFSLNETVIRALNNMTLKVLEGCPVNYVFSALMSRMALYTTTYLQTTKKADQKYIQVVVKCLMRLDIDAVLADTIILCSHEYLLQHPPSSFTNADDLPVRTIKTILQNVSRKQGSQLLEAADRLVGSQNLVTHFIRACLETREKALRAKSENERLAVESIKRQNNHPPSEPPLKVAARSIGVAGNAGDDPSPRQAPAGHPSTPGPSTRSPATVSHPSATTRVTSVSSAQVAPGPSLAPATVPPIVVRGAAAKPAATTPATVATRSSDNAPSVAAIFNRIRNHLTSLQGVEELYAYLKSTTDYAEFGVQFNRCSDVFKSYIKRKLQREAAEDSARPRDFVFPAVLNATP